MLLLKRYSARRRNSSSDRLSINSIDRSTNGSNAGKSHPFCSGVPFSSRISEVSNVFVDSAGVVFRQIQRPIGEPEIGRQSVVLFFAL